MVKTRMGLLDLRVQTSALHKALRGARVANVYDAQNGRTYILKLSVPPPRVQTSALEPASLSEPSTVADVKRSTSSSIASSWEKRLLLLESGVRVHMTEFDREKDVPSGFCLKLRKHIRARRLDAVRQLGNGGDRILELVFSAEGKPCAHLIIEAFSGGNVILTDADYTILTLLRSYRVSDPGGDSRVAVRERYPIENARQAASLTKERFTTTVQHALAAAPDEDAIAAATGRGARKKLQAKGVARKALAVELGLEPCVLEHALLTANLNADVTLKAMCDAKAVDTVFEALQNLEVTLEELMEKGEMKGYIVSTIVDSNGEKVEQYDEFAPYLFAQYRQRSYTEFKKFDEAADEFFASLEAKRAQASQAKKEAAAFKKVDKLESELKGQLAVFETARDISWQRAQAIEGNVVEVDAAITVIRSAIAASVPWDGLAKMVEDEKRNGNPVAEIIHSLQLERNEITLMLEDTFGSEDQEEEDDAVTTEEDEEEVESRISDNEEESQEHGEGMRRHAKLFTPSAETRKVLLVSVDLGLGAHANARRHYEQRKSATAKMAKASEATDRTLKAASKRAVTEAKKLEAEAVAASIRARRKALWFEKFYWFVSSENYLIVAGRDTQQNELLVKRYLGPADVYVHADLNGASSVIVKNRKYPGATVHSEIPRMTLEQAGTFAMCRSAAWDSKLVTSAWWVRATQVSKTSPTGDYLPPGSFSIRGKKNFLDPTQLVMGLGFLFRIDDSCVENHNGERTVRGFEVLMKGSDGKVAPTPEVADNTSAEAGSSFVDPGSSKVPSISVDGVSEVIEPSISSMVSKPLSEEDGPVNSHGTNTQEESSASMPTAAAQATGDQTEATQESATTPNKVPRAKKKHLSAKERRELKNARNSRSAVKNNKPENEEQQGSSEAAASTEVDEATDAKKGDTGPKANAPLPRGKKYKLKKMRKYKDQDEEERRIALTVLGAQPMKEETLEQSKEASNQDSDEQNQSDGSENQLKGSKKREERQEVMRLLDEDGLSELARLEDETVAALDTLTAVPTPEDVIQFALPVCAPHGALSKYRYKVKLMPGSTKRGKAYRSAVALFLKQAEKDLNTFRQERDAIRISPESDGIHGMLGGVKIMAPGLAEAQKSLRKSRKT